MYQRETEEEETQPLAQQIIVIAVLQGERGTAVLQTVARLIASNDTLLYLLTVISERQREEKPRKYFNEYNI